ncbi:MAG: methyl-accepting chemotaxis protein [Leptospirales bacterium]|nr:methyl-accepting chemotaxis protein [Leptospirales bacterium]
MAKNKVLEERKKMNVVVNDAEDVMRDGDTLISTTDLKGIVTYANREFLQIAGLEEDELIGKPHNVVRHPDMPRSAFQDLWSTLQADRPWNGMVRNRAKAGNYYWVDANVAPVMREGRKIGYMSVRRKPTRQQVDEADRLYNSVMRGKSRLRSSQRTGMSLNLRLILGLMSAAFFALAGSVAEFLTGIRGLGLIGGLLTGAVAVAGILWVQRTILAPVKEVTRVARAIAEGDLSARIVHDRPDEVGDLQRALLMMLINTAGIIGQIKENTFRLNQSAVHLNGASVELSNSAEAASEQSSTIAAAAEEMNQNLQVMSSAIEEMSITIGEVARKTAQAAQLVAETNNRAANSDDIVSTLSQKAQNIGKVIDAIASIADQTKLLALNASIEAANAGDAGRGFAVVASEVKELARQSFESAEEIKTEITGIQQSSAEVVRAINEIRDYVQQVTEISQAIASAVEEQSTTARESASNISQLTQASSSVAANINGVSQSVKVSSSNAEQATAMVSELNGMVQNLSAMVQRFAV